jgi:hypothetical protein
MTFCVGPGTVVPAAYTERMMPGLHTCTYMVRVLDMETHTPVESGVNVNCPNAV